MGKAGSVLIKQKKEREANNLDELQRLASLDSVESQVVRKYLQENHFSTIVDMEDNQ